jgi:hypothetical protein
MFLPWGEWNRRICTRPTERSIQDVEDKPYVVIFILERDESGEPVFKPAQVTIKPDQPKPRWRILKAVGVGAAGALGKQLFDVGWPMLLEWATYFLT